MRSFWNVVSCPEVTRTRSQRFTTIVATIQIASNNPRLTRHFHCPKTNGKVAALTRLTTNAQRSRVTKSGRLAFFQRATGPTPIKNIAGAINGINTRLKYGGPPDSFAPPSASTINGYIVPSNTEPAATVSNTLFESSSDSREITSNLPPSPTCRARHAYNTNEPPITMHKNGRIKMPRFGSVANACTEVSTPERTRNVPSRLNENAAIASSTVQLLKPPRCSVTASEFINAVPTSQGMNDAFSTGSLNHQPPQPSS